MSTKPRKPLSETQKANLASGRGKVQPQWSDDALCRLIWDARTEHGACTLAHLSRVTGQSKQAVASRLDTMKKRGLVVWSPGVGGSIRLPSETIYRKGV